MTSNNTNHDQSGLPRSELGNAMVFSKLALWVSPVEVDFAELRYEDPTNNSTISSLSLLSSHDLSFFNLLSLHDPPPSHGTLSECFSRFCCVCRMRKQARLGARLSLRKCK